MTKILYTSRTPVQQYQRCKRLRWLSTAEGKDGQGLEPARKSSHLVVGGAVHAGMAVLLGEGQKWLNESHFLDGSKVATLDVQLEFLFVQSRGHTDGKTVARQIEDAAVVAALAEFSSAWSDGVELDPEEARQRVQAAGGGADLSLDFSDLVARPLGAGASASGAGAQAESPIVVDFADFGMTLQAAPTDQTAGVPSSVPAYQPFDQDQWLKEEMAALVEGMVRCWARRRWRNLHENFIVQEVEQEGEWTLAEWNTSQCTCGHYHMKVEATNGTFIAIGCGVEGCECLDYQNQYELHFLSRHDALLLERATGYLYLQSFKTTGSWDRRKEIDAQVDMQGLSEAVDVERRFGEAWELLEDVRDSVDSFRSRSGSGKIALEPDSPVLLAKRARISDLVSPRVAQWLSALPDPPTILGVRYEYLLKGSRREDKKAQPGSPRWNQESILVRAYSQEGITSADHRWAWTYDWKDEGGKGRRLDYRSWQKVPVWKSMAISEWIDLLDAGKVQEGALDDDGNPLDALAAQLVPVVVAYRSADEMLDLLEQLESQEVEVAQNVEKVRQAEREGGYSGKRSALNKYFPQTRTACSYPGVCEMRSMPTRAGFCFGPPDPEHDSTVLEHFKPRTPNHPKESVLVQITKK